MEFPENIALNTKNKVQKVEDPSFVHQVLEDIFDA